MVNFQESPNPILDAVEKIYYVSEGSCLDSEKLKDCTQDVDLMCQFFNCNSQSAILLAILLRQYYQNEDPSVRDLIEHVGLKASATLYIHRLLEDFVNQDWVKPKQDIRYFPFTNYKFESRFIYCVTTKDWSHIKPKPIKSSFDLLDRFSNAYRERKTKEITYKKLLDYIEVLLSENEQLPISLFIKNSNMEPLEVVCYLNMCFRHYLGNEIFDFDSILEEIDPPLQEQFRLRQQINRKKAIFFQLDLIDEKLSDGILFSSLEYRLTELAIRSFNPEFTNEQKKINSLMFEVIEPTKIKSKNLYYGQEEIIQMEQLFELLKQNNFSLFSTRMEEKGMKPGLTILLYGAPGTGKTESVLQLAHKNNRVVLMVDVSSIRSKWVGETEKNIKRLFKHYKQTKKLCDQMPVLLFNEADAILGSRRFVSDRVEQMENSLQNILLQELEDFEGIFVATTNLEGNLDPAFDRRILYKVRFNPPTNVMRRAIWKDKLPYLSDEQISYINTRYELTGGQIDNVVKKIEISQLLNPNVIISSEYLNILAEEELSLRAKSIRNPIGFTYTTF